VPQNPSREAILFCRYILSSLDRLVQCLDGLDEKQLNWQPPAPHANSLYTLVVHTLGNAEENLLLTLSDQPSPRNREQEFAMKCQSAEALVAQWQILRERLQTTLLSLSLDDLEQEHLHPRRGSVTGLDLLIVVARHAAEHLGQAELTRDLVLASTLC
jgi:DinB superfamily